MADIKEGGVFNFTVVAKNGQGRVVPVTDASVVVDNTTLGTVVVNPDGTGGIFTAGGAPGDGNLVATAGGVSSSPFPVSVKEDNTVVSVEVVPVVTTVEIVPTP